MTLKRRKLVVSRPAGRDLQNIHDFASQFDATTAERLVRKPVFKIADLAHKGVTGSTRKFLPEGVRAFPFEKHCFYFTVSNDKLTLLRVLHSAQDTTEIEFSRDGDAE